MSSNAYGKRKASNQKRSGSASSVSKLSIDNSKDDKYKAMNVDAFDCFVVDCRWGRQLRSRRALKRHLRDVHNLIVPADKTGVSVEQGPSKCIFPECLFPTVDVELYRAHLGDTHSLNLEINLATVDVSYTLQVYDEEITVASTSNIDDTFLSTSSTSNVDDTFLRTFEDAFQKMVPEEKWTLSTGKVVEDELFKLGKKCGFEHPCHSWILDPADKTYTLEGHFTAKELKEIVSCHSVQLPDIPDQVAEFLNTLDADTATELRRQYLACPWSEPFNRDIDFDLDWVFGTMRMIIREYEAGNFRTDHRKLWYIFRIWSMINRLFDDIPGLETVRGESVSISTDLRKNENRVISSVSKMKKRTMGMWDGLLLQKGGAEYGYAEAGAKDEWPMGGLRAPKMLKDMLNNLALMCDHEKDLVAKLKTVGYIHSALTMEILIMDAPKGYVARLTRSIQYHVPQHPSNVRSMLLPLLSVLLSTKLLIKLVIDVVEPHQIQFKNAFKRQATPDHEETSKKRLPTCNYTPSKKRSKTYCKHCILFPDTKLLSDCQKTKPNGI